MGGVVAGFYYLTGSAAINIISNKDWHIWPLELSTKKLVRLEVPWVSGGNKVVVHSDYVTSKFEVIWNVDLASKEANAVFVVLLL